MIWLSMKISTGSPINFGNDNTVSFRQVRISLKARRFLEISTTKRWGTSLKKSIVWPSSMLGGSLEGMGILGKQQ